MTPATLNRCFVQGLSVLSLSVSMLADKAHQWETATVVSQNLGSTQAGAYVGPLGTGQVAAPINLKSNVVVVDTGEYW